MNVPLLRQPGDSQTRAHMHPRDAPGPHGSVEASQVHAWTGNAVRRELIRGNVAHFAILMTTLSFLQSISSHLVFLYFLQHNTVRGKDLGRDKELTRA